jgi:PKD domain
MVCGASVPAAEAGWLPPVDISEESEAAGSPHVVLDSEGNATAVWDRWNGTDTVVESAYRPAGEGWEAPIDLSEPELEGEVVLGSHDAQSPQIAVDRNGNVTVLWERYAGTKIVLQSVDRPFGGTWTSPADIGEVNLGASPEPWIAVDWEGRATAVWKDSGVIQTAFRPFAGSWEAPVPLSGDESFVPQAAMDARGDTTAVWMHFDGSHYVVESAYRPEGGEWESPTLVSEPGEEGGNPHVALDANGDSLVAWRGEDEGQGFVRAAYRPVGGSWGAATNVSSEGEAVQAVRDAVDPDGNAIVAWAGNTGEEGGHEIVHAAYKPVGGEWESPTELSAAGGNSFPSDVVFDTGGNAALVWQRWDGSSNVVQASYRPAGEAWEPAVDLSKEGAQGMDAVVVLDAPGDATAADGHATAVWVSEDDCPGETGSCVSGVVQAAGYDPEGLPTVELEIPATGIAGEPIEISTPTEELFAPLLEFGDGESVADTEASHVYEEPGKYEVTLAGAEVLGYRASAQRTITIAPAGSEDETESEPSDTGADQSQDPPVAGPTVATPLAEPPSSQCLAAVASRDSALQRLRIISAKLSHAGGAKEARRLAASKRAKAVAVRQARRRAAAAC